jgi:hypothetical protein
VQNPCVQKTIPLKNNVVSIIPFAVSGQKRGTDQTTDHEIRPAKGWKKKGKKDPGKIILDF